MKITLSTIGRFHMFPLAKELERHGVLERIYSGFPWSKLAREGVSKSRVKTFPYVRPLLMGTRVLPFQVPAPILDRLHQLSVVTLDHYVARHMPDSDIFVGHEGSGLISGAAAQKRGMLYVCDRGCAHMAWREEMLAEEYDRVGLKKRARPVTFDREVAEYEQADKIVVPSDFVKQSFLDKGIPESKLAISPYGVNTARFNRKSRPGDEYFDIIFVGRLSVRKGAKDLLDAFRLAQISNKRLTIVGTIEEEIKTLLQDQLEAPDIRLLGHVAHDDLAALYSKSHLFCLPSIEEGMAMVVAEAMACGCPPVVTFNTGNSSLVDDGKNGFIIPIRTPEAIAEKFELIAQNPELQREMSDAALQSVSALGGWEAYGQSMMEIYRQALAERETTS